MSFPANLAFSVSKTRGTYALNHDSQRPVFGAVCRDAAEGGGTRVSDVR